MDKVNLLNLKTISVSALLIVCLSILVFPDKASAASSPMYDIVLKGRSCEESRNRQLDCDYKIGSDFWLSIAAVGTPIATVYFMKSNSAGKYYASYGGAHGCVMIMRGDYFKDRDFIDVAYVSLKNGKVYKDWNDCQSAL